MTLVLGLVVVFGLVFGGFFISGGKMDILLHALPAEGMMISGGALGAFVIANSFLVLKQSAGGVLRVIKGPRWTDKHYADLLSLMFQLARLLRQKGVVALDSHIENPSNSAIFSEYPEILSDHFAMDLITDSFRMMSMQFEDSLALEDTLNRRIKKHHKEAMAPADAINGMADGLPAIGIVAAVLGVIKTMSSIAEPPEVLGTMIGGALVGTFLGVFMAYCMVSPVASRLKQIVGEDDAFYTVIRDIMVAIVAGHPPAICIEIGRGNIPSPKQPAFDKVEESQRNLPAAS